MQPIRMNSDATGALAADTAVQLNTTFGPTLSQSFLVKKIEYRLRATSANTEESFIIGLANGSATTAELASAIRDAVTDVDDATAVQTAGLHNVIWWETLRMFAISADTNGDAQVINESFSVGGGKGIPAKEATGLQVFAYNPAAAAMTAAFVHGLIVLKGIWLND